MKKKILSINFGIKDWSWHYNFYLQLTYFTSYLGFLRTITGELLDSALCYSIEIKANRKILMALVAYDNSDTSEYEDDENEGQSTRLLKENSVTIGWFSISLNLVICL